MFHHDHHVHLVQKKKRTCLWASRCTCRDAPRSSQHLHGRLSSKRRVALVLKFALDQHHSYLDPSGVSTRNLSISGCSQTSIPSNLCAMISTMLTTAFRIPSSRSVLLSSSRILQDHVDAGGNPARHSGAVRSSARCWLVSGRDAGHHASTCSATTHG